MTQTNTKTRGQKAAQTRAAAKARADAAEAAAILAHLPSPEQIEREAAEAMAEEAANLAAEAAELAAEAAARQRYDGPMLKLRERLKAGRYQKAPNGQPCCADATATLLGVLTPAQTERVCMIALGITSHAYGHLNVGQISMNLRNRVRNAMKRGEFGLGVLREAIEDVTGTFPDAPDADETEDDSEE